MEGMDLLAEASLAIYSTLTEAHIHLCSLGQLSGAHFIIEGTQTFPPPGVSTNNSPISACHSEYN